MHDLPDKFKNWRKFALMKDILHFVQDLLHLAKDKCLLFMLLVLQVCRVQVHCCLTCVVWLWTYVATVWTHLALRSTYVAIQWRNVQSNQDILHQIEDISLCCRLVVMRLEMCSLHYKACDTCSILYICCTDPVRAVVYMNVTYVDHSTYLTGHVQRVTRALRRYHVNSFDGFYVFNLSESRKA